MIKRIFVLVCLSVIYAATFWALYENGTEPLEAGFLAVAATVFAFLFWPREGRTPPPG
jgi:hypothetical protein